MNARNKALIFDEDQTGVTMDITLTDANGKDYSVEVVAALEIEELGKEFVAVLPVSERPEGMEEGEVLALEYSEDEAGNPVFEAIEDDEVMEIVSEAIAKVLNDEFDEEEEEEVVMAEGDSYLSDIGDIVPGVSIKE